MAWPCLSPPLPLCLSQEGEASWLPLFLAKGEQRPWELVSPPANSSPASGPGLVLTHDLGTCSGVSLLKIFKACPFCALHPAVLLTVTLLPWLPRSSRGGRSCLLPGPVCSCCEANRVIAALPYSQHLCPRVSTATTPLGSGPSPQMAAPSLRTDPPCSLSSEAPAHDRQLGPGLYGDLPTPPMPWARLLSLTSSQPSHH
ncbi:hypothetical protein J1605_015332 [Eschrichtius robustus]|uniref:Uncharacterized protein n=1 Tax=Eschrichtius robustus TaxID=9764 RepID=A0AB34GBI0_ESCRO|nr:hypothetical protein J1605_015332 [Eschrichtius robustus]